MRKAQDVVGPDGTVVHRRPVIGDMQWDGKLWRRWSGRRWATAAYALHPDQLRDETVLAHRPGLEQPTLDRALARAVEDQVSKNAASVVLDGPTGVVLGYPRHVAHLLHALLTLLTGGLWALVWLGLILGSRTDRVRLEVDRWGNVWAVPLASA